MDGAKDFTRAAGRHPVRMACAPATEPLDDGEPLVGTVGSRVLMTTLVESAAAWISRMAVASSGVRSVT